MIEPKIPTEEELRKRQDLVRRLEDMQKLSPLTPGPFPSTEEMQREDRER
jgi:hypothetical protein